MARRQLLTEEERRLLFGVPSDSDTLTRLYSLTRSDRELLAARRGNANRLGFAVQLALLRHPGMSLAHMEEPVDPLVAWLVERLDIPAAVFAKYAGRTQTMTDHARNLAAALGLRPASAADLPFMIEAGHAARFICDGLERGRSEIAFPPPMALLMKTARLVPGRLWTNLWRKASLP